MCISLCERTYHESITTLSQRSEQEERVVTVELESVERSIHIFIWHTQIVDTRNECCLEHTVFMCSMYYSQMPNPSSAHPPHLRSAKLLTTLSSRVPAHHAMRICDDRFSLRPAHPQAFRFSSLSTTSSAVASSSEPSRKTFPSECGASNALHTFTLSTRR